MGDQGSPGARPRGARRVGPPRPRPDRPGAGCLRRAVMTDALDVRAALRHDRLHPRRARDQRVLRRVWLPLAGAAGPRAARSRGGRALASRALPCDHARRCRPVVVLRRAAGPLAEGALGRYAPGRRLCRLVTGAAGAGGRDGAAAARSPAAGRSPCARRAAGGRGRARRAARITRSAAVATAAGRPSREASNRRRWKARGCVARPATGTCEPRR